MNYNEIVYQINNNATVFGFLVLTVAALWILALRKFEAVR